MPIAADDIKHHARPMLRNACGLYNVPQVRRFRALFGVSVAVATEMWNKVAPRVPAYSAPNHLLWALLFLKVYGSESVHCAICKVDEKTFRKWAWIFVVLISELQVIVWSNRLSGKQNKVEHSEKVCFVSVDGTDCTIRESSPFSLEWYSHKSHGPGVRYEVGISIETGDIGWVFGPFACGSNPDVNIFRSRMKLRLLENECVVADKSYQDESCVRDGIIETEDERFISNDAQGMKQQTGG